MGELIILAAFIILSIGVIPHLLDKYSAHFLTNIHILYAKDLVSFISNCVWIELNNIDYDINKLCIIAIDKVHANYCELKSLNDTFFEVEIRDGEVSLTHTLSSLNTNFVYYFKSSNGEWDYSDNPYSVYIQDLYQQMSYAKELRHMHEGEIRK